MSSPSLLHTDESDSLQVLAVFPEEATHADYALPRIRSAQHVEGETEGSDEPLISHQPPWLEQAHWSPPFPHDPKPSAFEQLQPFRGDKRLNADVDVQRQRTLDLMTDLAAGVIGHYAKLVDAVPAAAPEKPAHLTENPHLDLGGLHRKHGFAIRD
jgi:hypothetical protein